MGIQYCRPAGGIWRYYFISHYRILQHNAGLISLLSSIAPDELRAWAVVLGCACHDIPEQSCN